VSVCNKSGKIAGGPRKESQPSRDIADIAAIGKCNPFTPEDTEGAEELQERFTVGNRIADDRRDALRMIADES